MELQTIIIYIIIAIVIGVIGYYVYTNYVKKEGYKGCGCGCSEKLTLPMCPCKLYATSPYQYENLKEVAKNHKKYHGCDCEIIPKYDTTKMKSSFNLNEQYSRPPVTYNEIARNTKTNKLQKRIK